MSHRNFTQHHISALLFHGLHYPFCLYTLFFMFLLVTWGVSLFNTLVGTVVWSLAQRIIFLFLLSSTKERISLEWNGKSNTILNLAFSQCFEYCSMDMLTFFIGYISYKINFCINCLCHLSFNFIFIQKSIIMCLIFIRNYHLLDCMLILVQFW